MQYNPRFKETMRLSVLAEQYHKAGGPRALFYSAEDMLAFLHKKEGTEMVIKAGGFAGRSETPLMRRVHIDILEAIEKRGAMYVCDLVPAMTRVSDAKVREQIKVLVANGYIGRAHVPPPNNKVGGFWVELTFLEKGWEILGDPDKYLTGETE